MGNTASFKIRVTKVQDLGNLELSPKATVHPIKELTETLCLFLAAAKALEPVKEQLHQELAQKLTATDALLKDNIGKMVRSRVSFTSLISS